MCRVCEFDAVCEFPPGWEHTSHYQGEEHDLEQIVLPDLVEEDFSFGLLATISGTAW